MNLGAENNRFDTGYFKDIDVENGIPSGGGSGSLNNPLGTIISFMGTTPPVNYLACDGTVYDIDDYQELADFINAQFGSYDFFGGNGTTTFAVPDLRGEFLRGTGTNSHSNQGSGANVGVHQDGTGIPRFLLTSSTINFPCVPSGSNVHHASKTDSSYKSAVQSTTSMFINSDGTWSEDSNDEITARPTNTSVLYCIRYNSPTSAEISVWEENTDYELNQLVYGNNGLYICKIAHTSGSNFLADVTAGKWGLISGGGTVGNVQVGFITWQMCLMSDYLKLDGTPLADASTDYAELLAFAQDNNLITADATDNSLFKYDSTTDILTLPNYIDLVLQGGSTVEEKEAGLPNITGNVGVAFWGEDGLSGWTLNPTTNYYEKSYGGKALVLSFPNSSSYNGKDKGVSTYTATNEMLANKLEFNASRSSAIYSDSVNTVQPPAIQLIPQIKYRTTATATVNYSTTEQVIGTWIDGKPLYQKTIVDTMPTVLSDGVRTTKTIDVSALNINVGVDISGIVFQNINAPLVYYVPINSVNNSANDISRFAVFNSQNNTMDSIFLASSSIADNECTVYITLKYTKTTD